MLAEVALKVELLRVTFDVSVAMLIVNEKNECFIVNIHRLIC